MTLRGLSFVSLLAALAIGGYLFYAQTKTVGPTSEAAERAEQQAGAEVATANFQAAAPVLQAHYAEHATYAGAPLTPNYGVTLVRGDATSYCLQTNTGDAVQHLVGPAGAPTPGPC
jgi:hypothetical protein